MKIAFIGLGSIGQRHLTNLQAVAKELGIEVEVHAYRHSESSNHELVNQQFVGMTPRDNYDIVFITNPTSMHEQTILAFQNNTKMMVIEKPIYTQPIDANKLRSDVTYYVNCPLRHSPTFELLSHVAPSSVFAARAVCSSYLPDWRKSDYRNCYSASSELGGGVELDLIHEMDYLTTYLGYPQKISKTAAKLSDLEISSNDYANYLLLYADKAVELHLDYFSRITKREVELFTNEDTYVLDFVKKELRSSKEIIKANDEDMYIREMRYIFALVLGKVKNINDVNHANTVLSLSKTK